MKLYSLTSFKENDYHRTWKGHDWEVLDRLYEKGFIGDPKSKSKSDVFSDEGFEKSKKLFQEYFELK